MNLWQDNILLRTAKVVVTYLSVLLKTEYEQKGSLTITSILLNISNRLSQSPYTEVLYTSVKGLYESQLDTVLARFSIPQ